MREVFADILSYIMLMLTAITLQNSVFTRGLGTSHLLSLADDTTDTFVFTGILTLCTTISGMLYWTVNRFLLQNLSFKRYIRPLSAVVCMSVAFFVVLFIIVKKAPMKTVQKAVAAMPSAAFNTLILGTIFLTENYSMNLVQTIVFSIGSAIGFMVAVLMITEGKYKLNNDASPNAFKGLPSMLMYLAGLSMAIYALTGHPFSI
jgi:Na+-translocating ferredoxin:NAD+ oxidoreductase RnfA subunit